MGVYIPGMEMPTGCWWHDNGYNRECPLFDADHCCHELRRDVSINGGQRPSDCPLVPVTEPHGRLIDADGFEERLQKELQNALPYFATAAWRNHSIELVEAIISELNEEPTIIPAEAAQT